MPRPSTDSPGETVPPSERSRISWDGESVAAPAAVDADLARLAVDSYRDGWLNEGASASEFEARALRAQGAEERRALERIAADERSHAELGRDVVLWCYEESPRSVGRALAGA